MLLHIENVLTPEQVAQCRRRLAASDWVDGRITAGEQSARAKRNLQVPEGSDASRELGELILGALGRNPEFVSAALPLRVFPPLFNRYDAGMGFDTHVDNAIRFAGPVRYRTDLSATLFLSDPGDYDGGELIVEDTYGEHAVKLAAGDLILYPASSLHRVAPITRGSRWAAFFWTQSMVKSDEQRTLLWALDQAVQKLTLKVGQADPEVVSLTGTYHNLLRMWVEV
ncbi:Fe2+-dependent dioxygenase [Phenylobacterium hankyongense]|uniref:Fe2+-dependent dioxygenase n=1 Tax=Phenylobacterium hankyongense TaxID=1813876 RepID=A0A328AXY8_9CAUL|nr:Fe2+-dependent dioxygenase [Phenylobacterium hankyongense]RAK59783.1 Fe2+-dependent dioxygenase [Phenylobacterium hankyongense]